ncbi:copper homeostasis protein CutC [Cellulomonas chitinilytica]|uniref:PF03932 family protein CutC n=1 Tax=Cellulomonas chitinilytica TaxID=398759 RepID=A0A919TY57_9CELL|nr:copper homeostasis protein CutC [Cellulomonas chitinilytica]GIG20240.1 copper homeostasis protein CutC [Cellulomonas chitinilytica]
MNVQLEIAIQDPEGIAAAAAGGADRVELAAALALGGLTPAPGLTAAAVAAGVPVHVLVRPRDGGFDYSAIEQTVLLDDVRRALDAGAHGVVVGALRDGGVDTALIAAVRGLAKGAEVTFHRAFDTLADRDAALEQLVDLGVDRILTSGGASRAIDARDELARLAAVSRGRIQVMAGAGIDADNVDALLATGVAAIHASAKRSVEEVQAVRLGSRADAGASTREVTDEARVRALRAAVDAFRQTH